MPPPSASGVAVRSARPSDSAAIADIHIRTWQVAYAHVFPPDRLEELESARARRQRHWRELIESPPRGTHALIAEHADDVVGFASLGASREDASVGELYAIYVLPESWGGGAGPALMTEALARMLESGFSEAVLWVLEDNPRARTFYERTGWVYDGTSKEETFLETSVREVRYRIELDPH